VYSGWGRDWKEQFYNFANITNATIYGIYDGWNFNSGNYLFTTDTK